MTKLEKGSKVKVHYVGTLKDGTEFDSSRKREQLLEFTIDDGNLLKGFNDTVKNLKVGESKDISLEAKDAYGEYVDEAVITVKKDEFPKDFKFEVNGFIQGQDQMGRPVQGQIVKIEEESINLDLNHPLAGEDLNFNIELVEVVE
jgi:peptidylprolyl isomerase|tara:strand:+ start:1442 stop:1876 length:435 start_codon:yes stop_codon:yes gene_type:complete